MDQGSSHTFLFADLAGFTALTEVHGDERAADLVSRFCQEVAALLPAGAEQVKSIGDAVLVRISDAPSAVSLGLRIVEEVGGRHEFPVVRVGMHTGSAVSRDGDWFGSTVNLAARVASAADGGEVLVTDVTRAAAGVPDGIDFDAKGTHHFRNVSSAIELHRARAAGSRPRTLPIDPVCRMAVSPAHSRRLLHEDREFHFCSDGCAAAFDLDPELYTDVRRTPAPAASPEPSARASDAERESTLTRLKAAGADGRLTLEELTERVETALVARTRGELGELERDLPQPLGLAPTPVSDRRRWSVAIMSGNRQRGRWRAGARVGAFAMMGSAVLDLRHAELTSAEVHIRAIAVMGGVEIRVPDGVRVEGSGIALMGGNDLRQSGRHHDGGLAATPTIHVRAYSLMGGVKVRPSRRRRLADEEAPALPEGR